MLAFLSSPPRGYFSFPGGPPFGFWPESWDVIYSVLPQASWDYTCSQGQGTGGQQEEKLMGLCFVLLGLERKRRGLLRVSGPFCHCHCSRIAGLGWKETEKRHTHRFPQSVVVGAAFPTAQARQRPPRPRLCPCLLPISGRRLPEDLVCCWFEFWSSSPSHLLLQTFLSLQTAAPCILSLKHSCFQ